LICFQKFANKLVSKSGKVLSNTWIS